MFLPPKRHFFYCHGQLQSKLELKSTVYTPKDGVEASWLYYGTIYNAQIDKGMKRWTGMEDGVILFFAADLPPYLLKCSVINKTRI